MGVMILTHTQSIYLSNYLSIYPILFYSIYLSIYSIYLSIYNIYIYVHTHTHTYIYIYKYARVYLYIFFRYVYITLHPFYDTKDLLVHSSQSKFCCQARSQSARRSRIQ